ncbi:MAG: hypothetical protein D3908_08890, partial [Candidatus Electrothrix sp. AUS4]|nr:hypothetical protein [Candidatus Electrothrix sp. AUS4]
RQKKEEKTEDVLLTAIGYLPDYVPFHLLLGEIYFKRGEKVSAIKEYERAAVLDHENKEIQRRLEMLLEK